MDAVRDVVERAGGRIVAVADEPSAPLFPALAVRSSRASSPSSTSKAFAHHHLRRPSRPPELFVGAPGAFAASPPRARRSEWDSPPRRARDRTSAPCSPGTPRATRVSRDRAQTPLELPRVTATSCASVVGGAGRASGVLGAGAAFVAGNGKDRVAAARASHVVRYRGEEEEGGEEEAASERETTTPRR
jgi:hypothetical protein